MPKKSKDEEVPDIDEEPSTEPADETGPDSKEYANKIDTQNEMGDI